MPGLSGGTSVPFHSKRGSAMRSWSCTNRPGGSAKAGMQGDCSNQARQPDMADNTESVCLQVNCDVLNLLLDYCRFHRAPGRSDKVACSFAQLRVADQYLTPETAVDDTHSLPPCTALFTRVLATDKLQHSFRSASCLMRSSLD